MFFIVMLKINFRSTYIMNIKADILNVSKYIFGGVAVFLALFCSVNDKLSTINIAIISVISMLVFACIEYAYEIFSKKNTNTQKEDCNKFCSVEHMTESTKNESTKNEQELDYNKLREKIDKVAEEALQSNEKYVIKSDKIGRNADGSYTVNLTRSPQIVTTGSRPENDVISNETQYNYTDYNTHPPNLNEGTFENGYSFLPPSNWYPQPPHPPVCVAEKRCPVCPTFTSGTNIELKEWNSSRRVMQPDEINVKYVEEKLNAGR